MHFYYLYSDTSESAKPIISLRCLRLDLVWASQVLHGPNGRAFGGSFVKDNC